MSTIRRYNLVFTTERSVRHQQAAMAAAPDCLNTTILFKPDRQTLKSALLDADYLISERSGCIDSDLIQSAPHLRLIQRLGRLTHDIDLQAAAHENIEVCYWPIDSVINVAEHLIFQMLAVGKKVGLAQAQGFTSNPQDVDQRTTTADSFVYNWSQISGMQGLSGKTIGILGFGQIGVEVSRRLALWDCNILYHKRHQLPPNVESELNINYVDWDTLFASSNYLCNVLPDAGLGIVIDDRALSLMPSNSCFISCGSGGTIDFKALAQHLQTGHLAGVAVDSYDVEPPPSHHPLRLAAQQNYNVFLTPHIAACDTRDPIEKRRIDYDNILRHINNSPRQYVIV